MILFFRQKGKMTFPKKLHGNMMFSSNFLKRRSFQKNRLEYDLFRNIWKDGISFFPKINFFFTRKMKDDLSQKKKKVMEI